jgi:hypothetical protein
MDTNPPFSSPVKEYTQETMSATKTDNEVLDKTFVWNIMRTINYLKCILRDGNNELLEVTRYIYDNDPQFKGSFCQRSRG